MGLYNTLTKREQEVFAAGANHALDSIKTVVEITSMYNPDCTSIKIKDFYVIIERSKEKY